MASTFTSSLPFLRLKLEREHRRPELELVDQVFIMALAQAKIDEADPVFDNDPHSRQYRAEFLVWKHFCPEMRTSSIQYFLKPAGKPVTDQLQPGSEFSVLPSSSEIGPMLSFSTPPGSPSPHHFLVPESELENIHAQQNTRVAQDDPTTAASATGCDGLTYKMIFGSNSNFDGFKTPDTPDFPTLSSRHSSYTSGDTGYNPTALAGNNDGPAWAPQSMFESHVSLGLQSSNALPPTSKRLKKRYSVDELLHYRMSPLIKKPNLPSLDRWLDPLRRRTREKMNTRSRQPSRTTSGFQEHEQDSKLPLVVEAATDNVGAEIKLSIEIENLELTLSKKRGELAAVRKRQHSLEMSKFRLLNEEDLIML